MKQLAYRFKSAFGRLYVRSRLPSPVGGGLTRIGSAYGGWVIPEDLLQPGSVVYSAGLGEDITFELGALERYRCEVFGFDPTPRAKDHVKKVAAGRADFHYLEYGLWSSEALLRFYAPKNPAHVSHSVMNLQKTDRYFEARCRRVSKIMEEFGHHHVDLLKIDIEGAEYEVLRSVREDQLDIKAICVEFDQPTPPRMVVDATRALLSWRYSLVHVEKWNYTLVRRGLA